MLHLNHGVYPDYDYSMVCLYLFLSVNLRKHRVLVGKLPSSYFSNWFSSTSVQD